MAWSEQSGMGVCGLSLNIIMSFPTKHKVTCNLVYKVSSMSVFSKMGAAEVSTSSNL